MQINLSENPGRIGLKKTRGSNEILKFLENKNSPVDVSDINEYLQNQKITLNPATIYRIPDIFVEKGVVSKLEFQEGKFRYEIRGEEHHHLICQNCSRIENLTDCSTGILEKEIKKKNQFLVKRHALEFFGICKKCQS